MIKENIHTLPPDNLPLRPFEKTNHVWPFSRYKDVFYGEVMPIENPTLTKEEKKLVEKQQIEEVYIEKTPMTEKDKELILIASTMLFIVLLLLGYMYLNGRL